MVNWQYIACQHWAAGICEILGLKAAGNAARLAEFGCGLNLIKTDVGTLILINYSTQQPQRRDGDIKRQSIP